MPEIPDMEVIRRFLEPRLHENFVATVEARIPWLVRSGAAGLDTLVGHEFVTLRRHGKFLLFATDDDRLLAVNPMLTGRFHWAEPTERRQPMTALVLGFADGHQLRYFGARRMGRWYLVPTADLASVPQFAELGPDAMTVGEDELVVRLKRHPGQIKSTLTNQKFIAGIGNAYSDEILCEAGLHPHPPARHDGRGRPAALVRRDARSTIEGALPILAAEVSERLYQSNEEWCDHLRVHRKADQPCPRCGEPIHAQVRGGSETNYCLYCQPLTLG